MRPVRLLLCLLSISLLSLLVACQDGSGSGDFEWEPLFGAGTVDKSDPVARVGDLTISRHDLDLYYDELPDRLKKRYEGPEGRVLLLREMVSQTLMVRGAIDRELYKDEDVARSLIALRRNTLDTAMRNYGLLRDQAPGDDQMREFYEHHRDHYRRVGLVMARHVECLTRKDADEVYERLMQGGHKNSFPYVVGELSVNKETVKQGGELGWFTKGGFIPNVDGGALLADAVFDLRDGIHPPIRIQDRWHVVEIVERENSRPLTFSEAQDKVLRDMMPGFQQQIINDYLAEARTLYGVELFGEFGPGQGMNPEQLFARAMAVVDPVKKIDLFTMIYSDYPTSDRADDALFMAANVALESYDDRSIADRYLQILLEEYPDSDYAEDARFLKDNLYKPEVLSPSSIEELRK